MTSKYDIPTIYNLMDYHRQATIGQGWDEDLAIVYTNWVADHYLRDEDPIKTLSRFKRSKIWKDRKNDSLTGESGTPDPSDS